MKPTLNLVTSVWQEIGGSHITDLPYLYYSLNYFTFLKWFSTVDDCFIWNKTLSLFSLLFRFRLPTQYEFLYIFVGEQIRSPSFQVQCVPKYQVFYLHEFRLWTNIRRRSWHLHRRQRQIFKKFLLKFWLHISSSTWL